MDLKVNRRTLVAGLGATTTGVGNADAATSANSLTPSPDNIQANVPPRPPATPNVDLTDRGAFQSAISQDEIITGEFTEDDEFKAWKNLLTTFERKYSLVNLSGHLGDSPDSASAIEFKSTARSIDADFRYDSSQPKDFNYLHVETLLNQSADLLERCIIERQTFEAEASKAASIVLDVSQFLREERITRGEVKNGLFKLPDEEAKLSTRLSDTTRTYAEAARSSHKSSVDGTNSIREGNLAGFLAWLQYYGDNTDFDHVRINGKEDKRQSHAQNLAFDQALTISANQRNSTDAQIKLLEAQVSSEDDRRGLLVAREMWERSSRLSKLQRLSAARDLLILKMSLCCLDGGSLNFAERRDHSILRFSRDFNDAMNRMAALGKGLSLLYNYDLARDLSALDLDLGISRPLEQQQGKGTSKLDIATNAIRNAIAWLVRVQSSEQIHTHVAVLSADTIGREWQAGIQNGGRWEIAVSETDLPNQQYVRLRGVNIFVKTDDNSLWRCTLTIPKTGLIRWKNGSMKQLDQTHLPKLFFGRASDRNSVRSPESGAAAAIHNASPFGTWIVEASPISGASFRNLKELQIDFDVAVQMA